MNIPSSEIDLMAHWNANLCPIVNGIIFGDGRVKIISAIWQEEKKERFEYIFEPGGWTNLAELSTRGQLKWTDVICLCEAEDIMGNIRVLGGEGGFGGEGFVANIRIDNGKIIWLAYFINSNPFEMVKIQNNHIMAKTNLGTWWRFPLDNPDQITLHYEG